MTEIQEQRIKAKITKIKKDLAADKKNGEDFMMIAQDLDTYRPNYI
ncbi:hypothetical protein [Autumnicola psychrophila]|uniref:Uncharacterized protein n=1 Tax=Autumnicola psychrophila TaxID=3075592 RepID=A0ABU3DQ83_9FLAO|nr:hypothetical protein [Zunongwangia sp. F225]MDT0685879.1 hypothetical protein [Zunongwangia sp. F225]